MRRFFVILEGPDGTGKTTLSHKLMHDLGKLGLTTMKVPIFLPNNLTVKSVAISKDIDLNDKERQKLMCSDYLVTISSLQYGLSYGYNRSKVFVFDRFTPISSLVYSGDYDLVYEDVKVMMSITDKLFDPMYIIYYISNPPFRKMNNNDYFEHKIVKMGGIYNDVINNVFPSIMEELGIKHKLLISNVDLRKVEPKDILEDIVRICNE